MLFLPKVANAASGAENVVNTIVPKIVDVILMPVLTLVFAIAFIVFIWGVYVYFISDGDPDKRSQGRQHILWGIVGMTIMVSVFGIIRLVANTVGQGSNLGF